MSKKNIKNTKVSDIYSRMGKQDLANTIKSQANSIIK